jgi:hypothetical protein
MYQSPILLSARRDFARPVIVNAAGKTNDEGPLPSSFVHLHGGDVMTFTDMMAIVLVLLAILALYQERSEI